MIERMDVRGVHYAIDADLDKYLKKKIGKLDRYVSRHAQRSLHAEVRLSERKAKAKGQKECECEVILHLPQVVLTAKEATITMYAAIDVVEAKLKTQLKNYKDKHTPAKLHHRFFARMRTPEVPIEVE